MVSIPPPTPSTRPPALVLAPSVGQTLDHEEAPVQRDMGSAKSLLYGHSTCAHEVPTPTTTSTTTTTASYTFDYDSHDMLIKCNSRSFAAISSAVKAVPVFTGRPSRIEPVAHTLPVQALHWEEGDSYRSGVHFSVTFMSDRPMRFHGTYLAQEILGPACTPFIAIGESSSDNMQPLSPADFLGRGLKVHKT
ncbi:hypothetical protein CIB48_g10461 [Xylaria polymorpha]|nr:hypothetical protein CIB48_g10461 [Xylaria polymorpha]